MSLEESMKQNYIKKTKNNMVIKEARFDSGSFYKD